MPATKPVTAAEADAILKSGRTKFGVDIDDHQADQARRQAVRDARRDETLKCLSPIYAKQRELEKPVYRFEVSATWMGKDEKGEVTEFNSKQTVLAQSESDAWSAFCDKIGFYPSRRDAKPVIKRGKQVTVAEAAGGQDDDPMPKKTIGPASKQMQL